MHLAPRVTVGFGLWLVSICFALMMNINSSQTNRNQLVDLTVDLKSNIKPQQQTKANTIMAKATRYDVAPRRIQFDGFPVARLTPRIVLNGVGPWLFFDHMGPHDFEAGCAGRAWCCWYGKYRF